MARAPLATSQPEIIAAVADLGARMEAIESGLIDHRKVSEQGMNRLEATLKTMQESLNQALAQSAKANAELRLWRRVAGGMGTIALAALGVMVWLVDHAALVRKVWPN